MTTFLLRKLISALLYPPTFCLLIACAGFLLVVSGRFLKTGTVLLGIGLLGLLFLSIPAFQQPFIRWIESEPDNNPPEDVTAIVVLGSGVNAWDSPSPPSSQLSSSSLSRAMEGIRLAKHYPDIPLIFTGGTIGQRPASSAAMAALARELGIRPDRILAFDSPTSTWEEAQRTAQEIEPGKILLVSSALHVPRAAVLFTKTGFNPIPAPTDFLADESSTDLLDFLPSANAWLNWQRLFHEIYGRAWARLTSH
ncbi:YdcF family protein [Puniceicoccus vermicola]|uniref:YdcF family protein n=1 Tax=Puniceicoccus vermicola TaxID=388746 RepID=A0A7X1B274_9BACT|nr:ElyC/SanA/YdcF family protein [Puniceicoccus vermicola]MBC2604157.1 YdcF family protein [Puniceicoccus vermicola]